MGDYLIEGMDYELLGDIVCSLLTEDLGRETKFDYLDTGEEVQFRFLVGKEEEKVDLELGKMIELFETIDNLVVALYKVEKKEVKKEEMGSN